MRLWEGSIYTQVLGAIDKYAPRKVSGEGNVRKGKVRVGGLLATLAIGIGVRIVGRFSELHQRA